MNASVLNLVLQVSRKRERVDIGHVSAGSVKDLQPVQEWQKKHSKLVQSEPIQYWVAAEVRRTPCSGHGRSRGLYLILQVGVLSFVYAQTCEEVP